MLVIETWGGHNINDDVNYEAGFSPATLWGLPASHVRSIGRTGGWPVFGALERGEVPITFFISIVDLDAVRTLRNQLLGWFDPEDETPQQLIITDDGTDNPRYVMAVCNSIRPVVIGTVASESLFRVEVVVDGDVRWRSTAEVAPAAWNITASGDTNVFANAGNNDVYPVYKIKPTANKAAGYLYRCWVPIKWLSTNDGPAYPVMAIMDTATPVAAAKMQADGDDLRVLIDGTEVDRWLNDMNDATTDIWFSPNFTRAPALVLKTTIAGAGDIASIEFTDEVEVALLPDNGIILIDTEAFVYTARDLVGGAVTGVTREAKGTTIAGHAAGLTCYWIQHDVYIVYGNAAATAPVRDDFTEPQFTLAGSTNALWYYTTFREMPTMHADMGKVRPGAWSYQGIFSITGDCGVYGGTLRTWDTNTTVIGAWKEAAYNGGSCFANSWQLSNPCGIINLLWAGGQMRAEDITEFLAYLKYWPRGASFWLDQAQIAAPAAANNWENWSQAYAGADWTAAETIAMVLYVFNADVEVGTVTARLYAAEVPVVTVNAEQGNYELSAVLENTTTGEAININFVLDVDSELEIDTYDKITTWLEDDSRQFQAVTLDSNRKAWLRLQPGNNTLQFTDVGTDTLTITVTFRTRSY